MDSNMLQALFTSHPGGPVRPRSARGPPGTSGPAVRKADRLRGPPGTGRTGFMARPEPGGPRADRGRTVYVVRPVPGGPTGISLVRPAWYRGGPRKQADRSAGPPICRADRLRGPPGTGRTDRNLSPQNEGQPSAAFSLRRPKDRPQGLRRTGPSMLARIYQDFGLAMEDRIARSCRTWSPRRIMMIL